MNPSIISITTLILTIIGWFAVGLVSLYRERRLQREKKRQDVYESAYQFVIALGVRPYEPGKDDALMVKHQASLQAFGGVEVTTKFNEFVSAFVTAMNTIQLSGKSSGHFSTTEARIALVNAIRKENGLRKLDEAQLTILSVSQAD